MMTPAGRADAVARPRPTVSVVVCTKDRNDILARCLASVGRQEPLPDEVVVVDASASPSDHPATRLRAAVGDACLVTVLRTPPGLPRQRNVGARAARGEVVLFLDDDVVLEPGYLVALADVFARDAERAVGGVGGSQAPDPAGERSRLGRLYNRVFLLHQEGAGRVRRSGYGSFAFRVSRETDVEILSGCNMAYRREVLEALAFDERLAGYALGEDLQFSYRVSRRWRLVVTPHARLVHTQAGGGRPDPRARQAMSAFHHYLFVRECLATRHLDWAAFVWAELGCLLRALRHPGRGLVVGRLEGWARIRRHRRASGGAP